MTFTADELVRTSGVPLDTVRYYQTLGLLPPPAREGRRAVYDQGHLDRLRLIRSMSGRGLSLKVIGMLLERGGGERLDSDQALLAALKEQADPPSYTSAEIAERLGIPHSLLASIETTGLADALEHPDGSRRYGESDLRVAQGAIKLLRHGFPLTRLLALAVRHDRSIRQTVDDAIDLFNAHVRKSGKNEEDPEAVAQAFRELLPVVTALVAHHFQRVLVNRALKRLRKSGDEDALEQALSVAAKTRLDVRWS